VSPCGLIGVHDGIVRENAADTPRERSIPELSSETARCGRGLPRSQTKAHTGQRNGAPIDGLGTLKAHAAHCTSEGSTERSAMGPSLGGGV
jgi:hypothetical protein